MGFFLSHGPETTAPRPLLQRDAALIEHPAERQKLLDDPSLIERGRGARCALYPPLPTSAAPRPANRSSPGSRSRRTTGVDVVRVLEPRASRYEDRTGHVTAIPAPSLRRRRAAFLLGPPLARLELRILIEEDPGPLPAWSWPASGLHRFGLPEPAQDAARPPLGALIKRSYGDDR